MLGIGIEASHSRGMGHLFRVLNLLPALREAGIAYRKVMVEENMDLAKELGIRQAPTLVVGGETPEKLVGVGAVRKFITDSVKVC